MDYSSRGTHRTHRARCIRQPQRRPAHRYAFLLFVGWVVLAAITYASSSDQVALAEQGPYSTKNAPAKGAPRVLGITPGVGMRPGDIEGRAPIAVSFSQAMDKGSSQRALSLSPAVAGTFTWKQNTLIFTPSKPLAPSTNYVVKIGTTAKDAKGVRLASAISVNFQTTEPPTVLRTLPSPDASEVPTDAIVTVSFSRPMVPLTALNSQPDISKWVSIKPNVQGRWVWLGTASAGFRPTSSLLPSTEYSVAVKSGWPDAAGIGMRQGTAFKFTTVRPAIRAISPDYVGGGAPVDTPVVVHFNMPMERTPTEAAFRLHRALGNERVPGAFAWSPANDVMTFTAASLLDFDQSYQISFEGQVKPLVGSSAELAGNAEANQRVFKTAQTTRVIAQYPRSSLDRPSPPASEFSFTFNNALAPGQDVAAFLDIAPKPEGYNDRLILEGNFVRSEKVRLLANTTYHFELKAGLKDRWGFPVAPAGWDIFIGEVPPAPPRIEIAGAYGLSVMYAGAPSLVRMETTNVQTVTLRLYALNEQHLRDVVLEGIYPYLQRPIGELKQTWEVPVPPGENGRSTWYQSLSIDDTIDRLPPGYYFLDLDNRGLTVGETWTILKVGWTGFITKGEGQDLLIWAVNLESGAPVADYPLRVEQLGSANTNALEVQRGHTGADGVLRLNLNTVSEGNDFFVWSEKEGDAGFLSLGSRTTYYDTYLNEANVEYRAALYTDRPIYRPEQIVYYRGIYRLDDDALYSLPQAGTEVHLAAYIGEKTVYTGTATISNMGTFSGQFTLPLDAATGDYTLSIVSGGADPRRYYAAAAPSVSFDVEEYRKPDFQVSVTALPGVIQGSPVTATVRTSYYFGGPLANVDTAVATRSEPYYFSWRDPDRDEWYSFGEQYYYEGYRDDPVADDEVYISQQTDKDGTITVDVSQQVTTTDSSKTVLIEGQVTDLSNQAVASSAQTVVHQGLYYIGLASNYVLTAGEPATITVRTVAPDLTGREGGPTYPNALVRLSFSRIEWSAPDVGDGNWTRNEIAVAQGQLTTDIEGLATFSFTPAEPGEYRVMSESTDKLGNRIRSSRWLWVSGPSNGQVPWRYSNEQAVTLVADKEEYRVGDVARILVTSPFSQSTGLLTVERGHIRRYRIVNLEGNAPTVDVPLEEGDLPNVHVSLALLGPGYPPAGAPADLGVRAVLRSGSLNIALNLDVKRLQVGIEPGSGPIEPGTTSTVTVHIHDAADNPVAGEFSLAAVDEAIFALADVNTPDLFGNFWSERSSRVTTGQSLTSGWTPGAEPTPVTPLPPEVLPAAPVEGSASVLPVTGGGGGAPTRIRADFRDTAFWRHTVVTGPDGSAQVAIKWPDNLTTWRLTAWGVTADTQIGEGSAPLTVTQQLLVRPVQPRFFLEGDTPQPQAIIHNNTRHQLQLQASLVVSGAISLDPRVRSVQTVTVAPGAQAVVTWSARVARTGPSTGAGQAQANMRYWVHTVGDVGASNTGYLEDAVAMSLPVHPFAAPETVATSGEVDGLRADETVLIPYSVSPVLGEMVVEVSPSLAAATTDGVSYVKEYPYECSEQTTSRYLALVVLEQAYREQGRKTQFSSELPGILERAFRRLAELEQPGGGWGWWEHDYVGWWQTAYVVQGLAAARDAGYTVPTDMLQRGIVKLKDFQQSGHTPGLDEAHHLNTRAYSLYVLSGATEANDFLRQEGMDLVNQQPRMTVHARAWLAMALGRLDLRAEALRVLSGLVAGAKQTSSTAHWEETSIDYWSMSTDTRATALALDALISLKPDDPLVPKAIRWLVSSRREGHWRSTQETAISIITLAHYIRQSKELSADYTWQVAAFGKSLGKGTVNANNLTETTTLRTPVSSMPQNTQGNLALTRSAAKGKLYYSVSLRYYVPGEAIQARSEGLAITRSYHRSTGSDAVTEVRAGEVVRVRLQVVVPQTAYYVMITDPLPAGLEGVNDTLNTTSFTERPPDPRGSAVGGYGSDSYYNYCPRCYRWGPFDNVEMRDDRTVLFASYMAPGTYVYEYFARATTPGTYMALPARAELMYYPDIFGHGEGGTFTVKQP